MRVPCAGRSYFVYFLVALLAFKLLYISCELALNSILVATYATAPDDGRLHAVELLGRALSGIAAAVLVVRLGLRSRLPASRSAWAAFSAMLLIVAGSVVFGQRAAVNAIAAHASPVARRDAVLLETLPAALGASRAAIAGFPDGHDDGRSHSLLSLAPAIEYFDVNEIRRIEDHLDEVLFGPAMTAAIAGDTDPAWREFARFTADYHATFNRYADADRELLRVPYHADVITDDTYSSIQRTATADRMHFISATSAAGVVNLQTTLTDYFRDWWRRPIEIGLTLPSTREYVDEMQSLFDRPVDPHMWCDGWKCPGSLDFVRSRLTTSLVQASLDRDQVDPRRGYDPASKALSDKARLALVPLGATLPPNWRMTDRTGFLAAATESLRSAASQRVGASTQPQLCGANVPPGLMGLMFVIDRGVQAGLHCDLARRFGVAPPAFVYPDWTRDGFERHFLTPAISVAADEKRRFLAADSAYADGGALAESGRHAIVALLVPVVSLALSLFLGLWNLVSAATLVVTLWDAKRYERRMQLVTWLAGVAICAIPLAVPIGVATNGGIGDALATVASRSPAAATILDWVGITEPNVIAFADLDRRVVRNLIGPAPMAMARAAYPVLTAADCAVIRDCRTR